MQSVTAAVTQSLQAPERGRTPSGSSQFSKVLSLLFFPGKSRFFHGQQTFQVEAATAWVTPRALCTAPHMVAEGAGDTAEALEKGRDPSLT